MVTQNSCDFATGATGTSLTGNGVGSAPTFQNTNGLYVVGNTTGSVTTGNIGEAISSVVGRGAAVGLGASNNPQTITSITLSAGIWNIDCVGVVTFSSSTSGSYIGISTTTNTLTGNEGDSYCFSTYSQVTAATVQIVIPSFRATISGSTTYYMVGIGVFSAGSASGFGRITATRVG